MPGEASLSADEAREEGSAERALGVAGRGGQADGENILVDAGGLVVEEEGMIER